MAPPKTVLLATNPMDMMFRSRMENIAANLHLPTTHGESPDELTLGAQQALSKGQPPDLLILDLGLEWSLPGLSRLLGTKEFQDTTFVGYTNHANLSSMEKARKLGCHKVLTRSQLTKELPDIIRELLD